MASRARPSRTRHLTPRACVNGQAPKARCPRRGEAQPHPPALVCVAAARGVPLRGAIPRTPAGCSQERRTAPTTEILKGHRSELLEDALVPAVPCRIVRASIDVSPLRAPTRTVPRLRQPCPGSGVSKPLTPFASCRDRSPRPRLACVLPAVDDWHRPGARWRHSLW